ncbi:MAG TPA: hypothetical protein VHA57_10735, partial [Actinomycetota bacterium]|nr:hypothetical protein [Actinomycetota bacterium]
PASTSPEAATAPGLVVPAADPEPAPVASSSPPATLPAPPRAPAAEPEPVNNPYFPRGRSEPRANPTSPRSQPGVPANNPYFPWSEPEPDEPSFVRVVGAPATADREALPEPDGHEPGYQPKRRRLLRPSSVLGAIASLVLIYFALAGIFLLPPYSKAQKPPSSGAATGQGSTASAEALLSYIPDGIAPQCQSSPIPNPEVVASMSCVVTDTASDTIGIVYDQFGNSGSAKGAFSTDVTPDKQSWGPTSALATAQSCDPSVNPAFNETASYTRAASATVTVSDSGQVACWVSSVQEPTIDWTSDRRMVDANAVILRPSGSAPPTAADEQALYQFWLTQAGPK